MRTLLVLMLLATAPGQAAQFLWFSDIHFNPLAEPELVDKLAGSEPKDWAAILDSGTEKNFSGYGQDTNWMLLKSAVEAAKRAGPKVALTIVTGDFLVHHFREQFDRVATVHDDAAFREFVRKSMAFVALELKSIAPGKPVVAALGNNDEECGDYALEPNGPFLQDTQAIVADMAGLPNDDAFRKSWEATGSYSVKNPAVGRGRIIAVNSVLFSAKYQNSCGQDGGDAGKELLGQLHGLLQEAQKQHETVWLAYHIPPGVDGWASSHLKSGVSADTVVQLWKPAFVDEFSELVTRYRKVIAGSFAGHTHVDDFRLLGPAGKRSVVLIEPGLSPVVGQNPAFRIVTAKRNGELMDQTTYYLTNLTGAAPGNWKLEYSFGSTWGLKGLTVENYERLYGQIRDSPEVRARWTLFYSVSHADGVSTDTTWPAFYCATGNLADRDYRACVAGMKPGSGK